MGKKTKPEDGELSARDIEQDGLASVNTNPGKQQEQQQQNHLGLRSSLLPNSPNLEGNDRNSPPKFVETFQSFVVDHNYPILQLHPEAL